MDVSEIQSWDSGATNSGVAFNAPSNVTAGDDVVMSVFMVGGSNVTAVSGLGATWSKINGPIQYASGSYSLETWIGKGATGGTKAITVTTNGGVQYYAMCYQARNGGTAISGGTHQNGSGTTPTLTVTSITKGSLVIVATRNQNTSSASPGSPWSTYIGTNNFWQANSFFQTARQIAADNSDQTANWTQTSGNWATIGAILQPVAAAAVGGFLPLLKGG